MKTRYLLAFAVLLSLPGRAQQQYGSWTIHLAPAQLVFPEIVVGVEKYITPNHTLGLSFGYKFGKDISGDSVKRSLNQLYLMKEYNARTIALNSKWYLGPEKRHYIDLVLFQRSWWYDKTSYYTFTDAVNDRNRIQVWGMKVLAGHTFMADQPRKWMPFAHVYAGLGLRFKWSEREIFDSFIAGQHVAYEQQRSHYVTPSVHLGCQLGIRYTSAKRLLANASGPK